MLRRLVLLAAAVLVAGDIAVLWASVTVGLDHLEPTSSYDNLGNGSISGQTFEASFGSFAGVRVFIGTPSGIPPSLNLLVGPADLVLYDADDLSAPQEIARKRIACTGEEVTGAVDLFLAAPVPLVAGRTYFFGIETDDPFGLGLRDLFDSTYPSGAEAWISPASDPPLITKHFSGRDVSFLIYEGTVNLPPIADFSWCPVTPLIGEVVEFRDDSEEFPAHHSWDFDADQDEDAWQRNLSYAFPSAGVFPVDLEACNDYGCDTRSKYVTVEAAEISLSGPASGGVFDALEYTASATGCTPAPDGWTWNTERAAGGDATTATVSLSWSLAGDKELVVRNRMCGGASATLDVAISGIGQPAISPSGEHELLCFSALFGLPLTCVGGIDIDPARPTVVLVHGLQAKNELPRDLWSGFDYRWQAGKILHDLLGGSANILQYHWEDAFQGDLLPSINGKIATKQNYNAAREGVNDAGEELASLLTTFLGPSYAEPIHFIGHSLGTAVSATAIAKYLTQVPTLDTVQFTALDRPDPRHIAIIFGFESGEPDLQDYGYDGCYFDRTIRPALRSGLDLRVDNYYSLGIAGVGDWSDGLVTYNHPDLEDAGALDRLFDEGINNDHSGVHQWYRWTMRPVDEDSVSVCENVPAGESYRDPTNGALSESLNPCERGWAWALGNHLGETAPLSDFPEDNGVRFLCQSLEATAEVGGALSVGCGSGSSGSFLCSGAVAFSAPTAGTATAIPESTSSITEFPVPDDADYLVFNYEFLSLNGVAGDAYAAVLVDDVLLWRVSGSAVEVGVNKTSPPLPVSSLIGDQRLVVALFPNGDSSSQIQFSDFRFLQGVPEEQIDGALTQQAATEPAVVLSQELEVAEAALDSLAADDLTVPVEGAPWYLTQIVADGRYDGAGGTPLLNILIRGDSAGKPGAHVCTYDGLTTGTDFVDVAGTFTILLPESCSLAAGQYWLTVQADMDSAQGSWLWKTRLPTADHPAQWQNPGGGQGLGCTGWADASTCYEFPESRDLGFTLLGPPSCNAPSFLELRNDEVTTQRLYRACLSITATGFVISGPTADVTLEAGELVILENGFTVGTDAKLRIGTGEL